MRRRWMRSMLSRRRALNHRELRCTVHTPRDTHCSGGRSKLGEKVMTQVSWSGLKSYCLLYVKMVMNVKKLREKSWSSFKSISTPILKSIISRGAFLVCQQFMPTPVLSPSSQRFHSFWSRLPCSGWGRGTSRTWRCSQNQEVSVEEEGDTSEIRIQSVQCKINKVLSTSRVYTGPDPRTLGASPNMRFLASAGPNQNSFILEMLPDTGAGVTLLSYKLMRKLNISINIGERDSYSLTDASEQRMTVMGTVMMKVIPEGSCRQYTLHALVTDSMTSERGLLGYTDMKALGMLNDSFPVLKDHECTTMIKVGSPGFPAACKNSLRGKKRKNVTKSEKLNKQRDKLGTG